MGKAQHVEEATEAMRASYYITWWGEVFNFINVLPLIAFLRREMTVTDEDPGHSRRFKEGFYTNLMCCQKKIEDNGIPHVATALDPRFKSLKSLPREKRSTVWNLIENLLKDDTGSDPIPEPWAKFSKMFCFDSHSDDGEECGRPEGGQGGEYEYELCLYKAIPAEPVTSRSPLNSGKRTQRATPGCQSLLRIISVYQTQRCK